MMNAAEKLAALRAQLKAQEVDGFIIPRADEYQGEFVAPYAERLKYLTGFTGSGGIAAVLLDKAIVMSDGRYLIQLDQQVDVQHFKTGDMIKTPVEVWLAENAEEGAVIGYDPWLHTPAQIKKIEEKDIALKALDTNPLDDIWNDQPSRPDNPSFDFPEILAGASAQQKKQTIAKALKDKGADAAVLTLPDSICWLLNIRGSDTDYIPQKLSYLVLYADGTFSQDIGDFSALKDKTVLLDHKRSPIWFKHALEVVGAIVMDGEDPCIAPKATKSAAEQEAIKRAHIIDGVALVKFLHWLDEHAPGQSEISITKKLKSFRAQSPAFKGNSFPTIAGYAENGAIVHYRASVKTDKVIKGQGLLLVDSGGQYLDAEQGIAGTTDITRTIAIGAPTEEMKRHFTLVLKGHIAVATARFPEDTRGVEIDALARGPLKAEGLDYAHGTGHGVGCYLAVHEEAASISTRGEKPFEAGMLISNEPGYYQEGSHGIRIENLVLTQGGGDDFHFETISFAPIDQTLIIADMLESAEKQWLNIYHAQVYDALSSYLDGKELSWLKDQTAGID